MTALVYSKKFRQLFKEAENQFTSAINTQMPGKEEQSDTLVSPAITPNNTDQSQQEKAALTAKAMEKVKQSLEVSDELQSILNQIDKINKDVNANKWTLNDKNNTAYLPSKNAQIFKQNNYLCLSYNDKVELFKTVGELHDFLRKNNMPLPQNIKLHEAVEELGPLAKLLIKNHRVQYPDHILTPNEREERMRGAQKPMTKMSREDYVAAMKNPDELGVRRFDDKLQIQSPTGKWNDVKPKKECGATVGGSIGPAVQYTGKKLDEEEELQEVTPGDRGWKPGIVIDRDWNYLRGGEPDPTNPNEFDWSTYPVKGSRADIIAPLWFKWVTNGLKRDYLQFIPDKDANFFDNAENFIRTKHNSTTRSQRETSEWKDFWKKYMDNEPFFDTYAIHNKANSNPEYGKLTISNEDLLKIADDFASKGYGDLLNGLDRDDPELAQKFHPLNTERPEGYRLPDEKDGELASKSGFLYNATIDPSVRAAWYAGKTRKARITDEDRLVDFLAKRNNMSSQAYLDKILSADNTIDRFDGQRKAADVVPGKTPTRINAKKVSLDQLLNQTNPITAAQTDALKTYNTAPKDLYGKNNANTQKSDDITPPAPKKTNIVSDGSYKDDSALTNLYNTWKNELSDPNILADTVIDEIKKMSKIYSHNPRQWNSLIDALIHAAETDDDIDLSDLNTERLVNDMKLKETTSVGQAWLKLRQQNKDEVQLQEDDSPADFATGKSAAPDTSADTPTDTASASAPSSSADMDGDYAADDGSTAAPGPGPAVGFGDVNINAGDYSPEDVDQMAAPAPDMPEFKIIDVLVDENDPTKIKVRVKNKETGKVETKDLSEIDA